MPKPRYVTWRTAHPIKPRPVAAAAAAAAATAAAATASRSPAIAFASSACCQSPQLSNSHICPGPLHRCLSPCSLPPALQPQPRLSATACSSDCTTACSPANTPTAYSPGSTTCLLPPRPLHITTTACLPPSACCTDCLSQTRLSLPNHTSPTTTPTTTTPTHTSTPTLPASLP